MSATVSPSDNAQPLVGVVVLNWNGRANTLDCLDSLANTRYPGVFTVVADNGSTDGSVDAIRASYPDVELVENGANLGYAAGNNAGISQALRRGAHFVLVLNNDALVDSATIGTLVGAAARFPDAGIFGAKIFFDDGSQRLWFAGARWRADVQDFEHLGYGHADSETYRDVCDTDYASGCAMLVRSSVFRKIGMLDERYFLTYEETDFCYRARDAGFRCLFIPTAEVRHKVSASFGGELTPLHDYFYTRNVLLWGETHLPRRGFARLLLRTIRLAAGEDFGIPAIRGGARALYWNARAAIHRARSATGRASLRAKRLGLRDYLRRRFGDCPEEVRALSASASATPDMHRTQGRGTP